MKNKKYIYVFLLILVLAFLVRSFGLDQALYDDEVDYIVGFWNHEDFWLNPHTSMPPMTSWINDISAVLLGTEIWKFRLVALLFGMATIFLIFFLSRKIYKSNKAALIASGILGVSFYHILGSLQLGDEGSTSLFFITLFFYLYFTYKEKKRTFQLILCGLVFGLAMLIKPNAVLMLVIVGLYELYSKKNEKIKTNIFKTAKTIIPIFLLGVAIFAIFPLLVWLSNSILVGQVSGHMSRRLTFGFTLMGLSMFLFWITPFLLGLFTITAIADRKDKRNVLPIIWFLVIFIFYTFFVTGGDFSRYYMSLIIPIALVGGNFLSKIRWRVEGWLLGSLIFVFSYFLFNWLNKGVFEYVPRLMDVYLSRLLSFDWNFLFSYTSSSGPMFFLSFKSIMVAFIVSTILILLFFLYKDKNIKKYFLVAFIGFSFAFNVVVVQEYLFHVNHPDPGEAIDDFVDYYEENKEKFKKPFYANNAMILFYLDKHYIQDLKGKNEKYYYTGIYGENIERIKKLSEQKGGTVFLLDHTPIPRDGELWKWANSCDLKKEFKSKGKIFVYVFEC